jgi:hypothetical protein
VRRYGLLYETKRQAARRHAIRTLASAGTVDEQRGDLCLPPTVGGWGLAVGWTLAPRSERAAAPCSSRASQSSPERRAHVRAALLNAAGRRRSPVTLPGYLAGRPPRNKGLRYPPDPPTVEEIVAVMREAATLPTARACGR